MCRSATPPTCLSHEVWVPGTSPLSAASLQQGSSPGKMLSLHTKSSSLLRLHWRTKVTSDAVACGSKRLGYSTGRILGKTCVWQLGHAGLVPSHPSPSGLACPFLPRLIVSRPAPSRPVPFCSVRFPHHGFLCFLYRDSALSLSSRTPFLARAPGISFHLKGISELEAPRW